MMDWNDSGIARILNASVEIVVILENGFYCNSSKPYLNLELLTTVPRASSCLDRNLITPMCPTIGSEFPPLVRLAVGDRNHTCEWVVCLAFYFVLKRVKSCRRKPWFWAPFKDNLSLNFAWAHYSERTLTIL